MNLEFKLINIVLSFFYIVSDGGGEGDLADPNDECCIQFLVSSYGQRGDHSWTKSWVHVEDTRLEWVAPYRWGYTAVPHHPNLARRDPQCVLIQLSRNIFIDRTSKTFRGTRAIAWCRSCWLSSIWTYSSRWLLVRNSLFLQVPSLHVMMVRMLPAMQLT